MPLCKGRNEVLVVCKITNLHGCARQFSRRDGVQLPSTLKTKVRTFSVVATKCWVSCSDWLDVAFVSQLALKLVEGGEDETCQFCVLSKENTWDRHQFATGSGAQAGNHNETPRKVTAAS